MKFKETNRGFLLAEFEDRYGQLCSIQESSLATDDCIWLGVTRGIPKKFGGSEQDIQGRMHLTREMVSSLLPPLLYFVETGALPHE